MKKTLVRTGLLALFLATTPLAVRAELPPSGLPDLVAKLLPEVVSISFVAYEKNAEGGNSIVPKHAGVGSGYIVDSQGIIVTNRHVTDGGSTIFVNLADNTQLPAELIYRSPDIDMALLRVKPSKSLPTVTLGDSDTMKQGDQVIAIGNPLGLSGTVTTGIISARDRDIHETALDSFMQIDAAINPGNSGGPLFNTKGEVVGMNTALYSVPGATASGSIGLNFSIPINDVKFILDNLHKYGRVRTGFLDAYLQNITPGLADAWGLPTVNGAIVATVSPNGPAALGGLKPGDIIQKIGPKPIENLRGATRAITALPATEVPFEVLRDGKPVTLSVKIGETKFDTQQVDMSMPPLRKMTITAAALGVNGSAITPELRKQFNIPATRNGVVLTEVAPTGLGAYLGFNVGNVIMMANGRTVTTAQDLFEAAKDARSAGRNNLAVLYFDGKAEAWLAVPIEEAG